MNNESFPDNLQLARLADFFNEVGMLKHTPRTGFAFLGSGSENVADHSFRTAIIGYVLAKLAGADQNKVAFMCLFHDLHEARTGDFNYVNHLYDTCKAREALRDATKNTGLESEITGLCAEFEEKDTLEAILANDADQLDLICNLRLELWKGNEFARQWLDSALPRLRNPVSIRVAQAIMERDPQDWWHDVADEEWWIYRGQKQ